MTYFYSTAIFIMFFGLARGQALEYEVAQRVVVVPGERQLRVGLGGDPGQVWRALGMLGTLDSQMERLAQVLLEGIAAPLLSQPQPIRLTFVRPSPLPLVFRFPPRCIPPLGAPAPSLCLQASVVSFRACISCLHVRGARACTPFAFLIEV